MTGYISKIDGEQQPYTVKQMGFMVTGGNANITVHFDRGHDSTVPEGIIHGVQWFIGPEPVDDSVIADCLIKAVEIDLDYESNKQRKANEEEATARERSEQFRTLPDKYSYLETTEAYSKRTGKSYCDRVCAAANIKKELAREFPGVKFSVKGSSFSGGDDINVSWDDGPTSEQVDKITDKYEDHATDETGDYRDPTNHVFNKLFGGAKYVFTNRHLTNEQVKQAEAEAYIREHCNCEGTAPNDRFGNRWVSDMARSMIYNQAQGETVHQSYKKVIEGVK
jgi:hypothetical protein